MYNHWEIVGGVRPATIQVREADMSNSCASRRVMQVMFRVGAIATIVVSTFAWVGLVRAGDLDPKAIVISLPNQINWKESPAGSAQAILEGDPSKPGHYMVLTKWHAGHM